MSYYIGLTRILTYIPTYIYIYHTLIMITGIPTYILYITYIIIYDIYNLS